MKNLLFLFLMVFAVVSCQKDKCAKITCQNNGTCNDGVCACPAGYTGNLCQTPPPTPTAMRITKIEVLQFNFQNALGTAWDMDAGTRPDIYPKLELNGTTLYTSPTYYQECISGNVYSFSNISVTITNLYDINTIVILYLFDYDSPTESDQMVAYNFSPSLYSSLSNEINLNSGAYSFRLTVEWLF